MSIALVVTDGPHLKETLLSAEECLPEFAWTFMPDDELDLDGVSWVFWLPAGWVLTQVVPLEKMRRVLERDADLTLMTLRAGDVPVGCVEQSDQCGAWLEHSGVTGMWPCLSPSVPREGTRSAIWGRTTDEPRAQLLVAP